MTDFCQNIMINNSIKFIFSILLLVLISFSSCKKNSYPCPGNGQSTASSLSKFDDDGNLKETRRRKKSKGKDERGLMNKQQDDRLKARRKTSLGDKPKNMKK